MGPDIASPMRWCTKWSIRISCSRVAPSCTRRRGARARRAPPPLPGDRAAAGRLHRKIGALHWEAGDRERAGACFASGLDRLGDDGDPLERAHLFQEMGRLAFRAGDNAGAIEWAERALAEAPSEEQTSTHPERSRQAAATQAQAYNTLVIARARPWRLHDAIAPIDAANGAAQA